MKAQQRLLIALASICLLASCSKSDSGSSTGGSKVSLHIANGASSRESLSDWLLASRFLPAGDYAMNTATGLQSLKYLIGSIAICNSVTTQGGFGFSASSGCVSLYSADTPPYSLDGYPADISLAHFNAAASLQTDFATAAGRARLAGSATVAAGTYNYAIVTWYPGIGVRASIDVGGTTLVTKSGGTVASGATIVTSGVADMSSGTAEDAFVVSPNGGAAFRFASPFTVTASGDYTLDMTFNPSQVLSACKNCPAAGNFQDVANHGMYVPMLTLLPVPHLATDTTSRETYLVTVDTNKKIRIELYFPTSDPTKVYGVSAYLVFDNTAASPPFGATDTCRVTDVTTNTDGSLKLENNAYGTVANKLVRRANGTVDTNTGMVCGGNSTGLAYTYVGTDTVN